VSAYIYFIFYLTMINLVSVCVTVADKRKAKLHRWRVPEHTLLFLSVLGGSPAMLVTMLLIRHKTRHPKFMVGIPLILLIQAMAVYWIAAHRF
jgi:uncharacterized membrane protein YsdA (DUF1294 family)